MSEKISEITIDHHLPQKFATLIGDKNPIHIDDHYARDHGFKGAILQGMATFCSVIREVIGDDDPSTLRSLSVRFEAPVYAGEKVVLRTNNDGKTVVLTLVDQRGQLLLSGKADLR
jgi:3-hydroxybutyryl-CoA dehydratase